ncbi:MAG: hypothetical protein GC162_17240 [Planctomycetes bacterium]|nr:hypothetical protein [Planctomycetota bacterium]
MLIGINLIGFIVRGFLWKPPPIEPSTERVQELLANESRRMSRSNAAVTLLFIVVTAGYLGALAYFWNYLLAVAAGIIMVARLPDLIWEIKTGQKVTRSNAAQSVLGYAGIVLALLALPVVWYALCRLSQ